MRLINLFAIVAVVFLIFAWLFHPVEYCKVYRQGDMIMVIKRIEYGYIHYDIKYPRDTIRRTVKEKNFNIDGWECVQ